MDNVDNVALSIMMENERKQVLSYHKAQLFDLLADDHLPRFRVGQFYQQAQQYTEVDHMSELPKNLRERLKQRFVVRVLEIQDKFISVDGTIKYLMSLSDGNCIECVFMQQNYGNTLCISTQVGCRMGCAFCASGQGGLIRNLTAGEMLAEVLLVNQDNGGTRDKRVVTNIVLMGSGEPFDNYEEVVRFLRLVNDKEGIGVSFRNISLSTSGIVPKILTFAQEGIDLTLAISLHAVFDEKRRQVMPIANKYSVLEVVQAAKAYFKATGRRFVVEYAMIKGFNTSIEDADRLYALLAHTTCHINLIPLNVIRESPFQGTNTEESLAFQSLLEERGLSVTIRRRTGSDISGSCGQLRQRVLREVDGTPN